MLKETVKPILALTIILLGFGYFYSATFTGVNPNDQILIAIVGLMSMAAGYYFGSSSGTSKKDDIIQNMAEPKHICKDYDVDNRCTECGKIQVTI